MGDAHAQFTDRFLPVHRVVGIEQDIARRITDRVRGKLQAVLRHPPNHREQPVRRDVEYAAVSVVADTVIFVPAPRLMQVGAAREHAAIEPDLGADEPQPRVGCSQRARRDAVDGGEDGGHRTHRGKGLRHRHAERQGTVCPQFLVTLDRLRRRPAVTHRSEACLVVVEEQRLQPFAALRRGRHAPRIGYFNIPSQPADEAGGIARGVFFEITGSAVLHRPRAVERALFQRQRVEHIVRPGAEIHRVVGGHCIEFCSCREARFLQPRDEHLLQRDPPACRYHSRPSRDVVQHLANRFHAWNLVVELEHRRRWRVHVRVDQPRQHRAPAEIAHRREALPRERADLARASDRRNFPAAHGERFPHRERGVDGEDVTAEKNRVGRRFLRAAQSAEGTKQTED